jgi:NAD+ kinase
MRRIGVVVHPTRPVGDSVDALCSWAEEHGIEVVQIPTGRQPVVATPGEVGRCDLIAALGGDGTVLRALHASARTGTPVLGVAHGSLGILTTVPHEMLRESLDRIAHGDCFEQQLPALALEGDEPLQRAINDIALVRRGGTQLIVKVCVEDELYARVAGDGVVVATPLGSSAYSMAAGGPLVVGGVNGFACSPLSTHGGFVPPLVVPDDTALSLEVHPGHDGFAVQVDGFEFTTQAKRFVITCEPGYAKLVSLDGASTGGVRRLRERGLISDSPRIVAESAREHLPAQAPQSR